MKCSFRFVIDLAASLPSGYLGHMRIVFGIVLCALAGAAGATIVVARPGPPPADLLRDIAQVDKQVVDATAEADAAGGVIGVEARLRLSILRTSAAMLEQRRAAWLRGINVTYPNARPGVLLSQEEIARLQADMKRSGDDAALAQADAAQYTGGLIQSLDLVRAATNRVTVAKVQQDLVFAHYGQPILAATSGQAAQPSTPGKVASDKDAL